VEETIFLGPEEVNAVADVVGERYGPMVLLAGYRGLRFGELAGLRPHRIQFLRGRLEVVEALKETGDGHYFGPPKYGRVRSVPLPPFLVEELAGYLAKFAPEHDSGLHQPGGFDAAALELQPASVGTCCRLRRGGSALNFPWPAAHRRSQSCTRLDQRASLVELAAIMGWSRSTAAAMTMRYGHLFAGQEKRLTEPVEQAYRAARWSGDGLEVSGDE
jgi:integrase